MNLIMVIISRKTKYLLILLESLELIALNPVNDIIIQQKLFIIINISKSEKSSHSSLYA